MAFATNYRAAEDAKFWMGVCQLEQNMLEPAAETLDAYWRRYQEGGKWIPQAALLRGLVAGQGGEVWPGGATDQRGFAAASRGRSAAAHVRAVCSPLACRPRRGEFARSEFAPPGTGRTEIGAAIAAAGPRFKRSARRDPRIREARPSEQSAGGFRTAFQGPCSPRDF